MPFSLQWRNIVEKLSPLWQLIQKHSVVVVLSLFVGGIIIVGSIFGFMNWQSLQQRNQELSTEKQSLEKNLDGLEEELEVLKNEDQKVRNDTLQNELTQLKEANSLATDEYERLLNLQDKKYDTTKLEASWATILAFLAENKYSSASASLTAFQGELRSAEQELAVQAAVPAPTTSVTSNEAPSSGYTRQRVETEIGSYVVSLTAGDLNSTRVIVDTASGSDCGNDCPVLPLGDYVSRNGAYAGINGTYFCPASYPSCAGKTNTFDLLVMNKDKTYFNSDNNVYSTNPAVIFSSGSVRFVSQASQWGRDTSVDGVLSNFPLLLSGGEIRFAGDGDPKKGSKGNRSFVANKGNTVYIGVVHSATVAEAAWALKTLGMENALNLDNGGSTAFWASGYKVGPGRNIPNAILFVRK